MIKFQLGGCRARGGRRGKKSPNVGNPERRGVLMMRSDLKKSSCLGEMMGRDLEKKVWGVGCRR